MFSGYYQPQDNIASVIPCSPEMSIRTTIADGLIAKEESHLISPDQRINKS